MPLPRWLKNWEERQQSWNSWREQGFRGTTCCASSPSGTMQFERQGSGRGEARQQNRIGRLVRPKSESPMEIRWTFARCGTSR